jgi:Flp pilus assembly protein TadG
MRTRIATVIYACLRAPPRGGPLIEFALIAPLLVLFLVAVGDLGFAAYDMLQVQAAAEAGAQYAALNAWNAAAIATAVSSATGIGGITATPAPSQLCGCPDGGSLTQTSCGNTCPSGSPAGLYASVSAQLQYRPVLPYPGLPSPLRLTGQAYRRLR